MFEMIKKNYTLKLVRDFAYDNYPMHYHHNFNHAKDVALSTERLCKLENIDNRHSFLLKTAAYLHDLVYVIGAKDNEEKSVKKSAKFLLHHNYSKNDVLTIKDLIIATKIPTKPKNLYEQIICDADADNLGREDFISVGKNLQKEARVEDNLKWYTMQVSFMKSHTYYTKSAQKLRNNGLKDNIHKLESIIHSLELLKDKGVYL